jgi:hypothetical protein
MLEEKVIHKDRSVRYVVIALIIFTDSLNRKVVVEIFPKCVLYKVLQFQNNVYLHPSTDAIL